MKHAASTIWDTVDTIWDTVEPGEPKHSRGWRLFDQRYDRACGDFLNLPYTPGRHAKPFAAHHPARPVTYDAAGNTTPLNPPTNALDVAA